MNSATASTSIHIQPDQSNPVETVIQEQAQAQEQIDDLLNDLERELDDDFDLGGFRERRMQELRSEVNRNQKLRESDYGKYTEIKNEKDLIAATAKAHRSVIHFFHRDFKRCRIMDKHLEILAARHITTLFLRAEVSNVPFLVAKMQVQVLPCVVGFVAGQSKMKIVGFEELPGGDGFTTATLELTMLQCDIINPNSNSSLAATKSGSTTKSTQQQSSRRIRGREEDDSDDLDD